MKPRRKKIYAALISLGLAAVVLDRILGPGASDAPAAAQAADAARKAPGATSPALPESAQVEAAPFPRNMPPLPDAEPARDPFAPPWQQLRDPDEPGAAGPGAQPGGPLGPPPATSVTFGQSHRLAAVLADGDRGIVILDDQLLRIGQTIDECTLTAVENAEATFLCSDGPVILHVEAHRGTMP